MASPTLAAATDNIPLLTTIAAGFAAAWVLGLITHRLGLSPIVGYLLAGVAIGPYTPGYTGNVDIALQLAEVGVILLMFGVGLHFNLKDLLAVKRIALPGAIGQSLLATTSALVLFTLVGWEFKPALVVGLAMSVASTVVLLRVLMDRGLLKTSHGHAAVGWLIVEDIFTVVALVLVPILAGGSAVDPNFVGPLPADGGAAPAPSSVATIGWAILKLVALFAIVLLAGSRVVPWVLTRVARLRSSELFTLTVLVLSVTIAVGSATFFGASVALGAFLAGMVVGQSPASHQAAADALPMRDAFSVLFFVSVGMLFDPSFVVAEPLLVSMGLVIVLVVKPIAALGIVAFLGYPARTALTVAIGLAQIGEFSFILAQVARDHALLPGSATHLLVATAIISITINPLLFRALDGIERWAQAHPRVWRLLNGRADRAQAQLNAAAAAAALEGIGRPLAVIVGYGPVGRLVDAMLRDAGLATVIVDMNIDTVRSITRNKHLAIFGDATRPSVLEQAGIRRAEHLVVTLPHSSGRADLVRAARELNPGVAITVRARYLAERDGLREAGAARIAYEEGEAGLALTRHVMEARGAPQAVIERLVAAVRKLWKMDN